MIIRAITKSGRKGDDKYTVYFWDGRCLTLNTNSECQGMSQWSDYFGINDADFETRTVNGQKMINWFDIPVILQAHIEKMIRCSAAE